MKKTLVNAKVRYFLVVRSSDGSCMAVMHLKVTGSKSATAVKQQKMNQR